MNSTYRSMMVRRAIMTRRPEIIWSRTRRTERAVMVLLLKHPQPMAGSISEAWGRGDLTGTVVRTMVV